MACTDKRRNVAQQKDGVLPWGGITYALEQTEHTGGEGGKRTVVPLRSNLEK